MINKELNIIIGGTAGTGKTYISFLIERFLRGEGFEVNIQTEMDFKDVEHRINYCKMIDEHRVNPLPTINISTVQLKIK